MIGGLSSRRDGQMTLNFMDLTNTYTHSMIETKDFFLITLRNTTNNSRICHHLKLRLSNLDI